MGVRIVTALAALVSAVVHGYLWVDGYRDIDVIGPAFLVNAVAGAVIAVLLLVWRHWVPAFLVTGFGASTLGAFVVLQVLAGAGQHLRQCSGDALVGGVGEDFGLAAAWAGARTLRLADGPDEVHREAIARLELSRT